MSFWQIILRVLLGVALVLNGASGAAAAVRMQMPHADGHAETTLTKESPDISAVDAPCHQEAAAVVSKGQGAAADPEPAKPKPPSPECCKSSSCNCVCVQAAQAPPASAFIDTLLAGHSQSVRPLLLGHPAPALPHLNRPPIG
jgi:hypothetical protein